jgi:hypothetical protein
MLLFVYWVFGNSSRSLSKQGQRQNKTAGYGTAPGGSSQKPGFQVHLLFSSLQ